MKKVFMCAKFGYYEEILDGQSLRSRSIKNYLSENKKIGIEIFDTSEIKFKKIKSIFKIINYLFRSQKSIFALAHKGTYIIMPFAIIISIFLLKKEVYFVAIGGWLPKYLEKKFLLKKLMKRVTKIYVQTEAMKKELEEQKFQNVEQLLNFRINDYSKYPVKQVEKQKRKFVFISRVIEAKGIEKSIEVMNSIMEQFNDLDIKFDFYGPVESEVYLKKLKELILFKEKINYKGILKPNEIVKTLNNYDVMLFPTFYEGEGFPGVIIDANQAGIAIIASDWKYNKDFVEHGKEGLIFSNNNIELKKSITKVLLDSQKLFDMKKQSRNRAEQYKPSIIMEKFEKELLKGELNEKSSKKKYKKVFE